MKLFFAPKWRYKTLLYSRKIIVTYQKKVKICLFIYFYFYVKNHTIIQFFQCMLSVNTKTKNNFDFSGHFLGILSPQLVLQMFLKALSTICFSFWARCHKLYLIKHNIRFKSEMSEILQKPIFKFAVFCFFCKNVSKMHLARPTIGR